MTEIMRYQRWWPLDDIEISRAHVDGRTVVAYATVFDTAYPVSDQYGDYEEVVERSAFNNWLSTGGIERAMCLYNHGFTVHGSPSDAYSVPLGRPLEIRPDGKGLYTVTRYNEGPDVDRVLEAIRNSAIRGQSFRGRIIRSTPPGRGRRHVLGHDGKRTTVVRHELGLSDYGPTPMPVNSGAEILAVRSYLSGLDGGRLAELIRSLAPTTPWEPEAPSTSSETEAGAEGPPDLDEVGHPRRQSDIARIARSALITRE